MPAPYYAGQLFAGGVPGAPSGPSAPPAAAPSGDRISQLFQHWYPGNYAAQPGTANPGGVLTAGPAYNYSPTAGGIPSVPSPASTQAQSILGNQQNFGGISQLANQTAQLNAGLGALPYQLNLPNYGGLLGQASQNAGSLLQGQVPSDIQRNLIQAAAQRGIATGLPGAQATNASYLQALGLTGLGLQQQGLQNFGQLMGMTPTGPQFNPASLYVSPDQYQQAQTAANLYNAAPIPSYAQSAQFNALNAGLSRGQQATQPQQPRTQSADLVASILQKYAPTAVGFGQGGVPNPPPGTQGYAAQYGSSIGPPDALTQDDANYLFYGDQGLDTSYPIGDYGTDYGSDYGGFG